MADYGVLINDILNVLYSINGKLTAESSILKSPHSTDNEGKINRFIRIISKHGWKGVGLVAGSNGTLLTGTHRYHAVKQMGWEDKGYTCVVNIKSLCELHGVDIRGLNNKGPILRGKLSLDETRSKLHRQVVKKYGL